VEQAQAMSNQNQEYREICQRLREIADLLEDLIGIIEKQNNAVASLFKPPEKPRGIYT